MNSRSITTFDDPPRRCKPQPSFHDEKVGAFLRANPVILFGTTVWNAARPK